MKLLKGLFNKLIPRERVHHGKQMPNLLVVKCPLFTETKGSLVHSKAWWPFKTLCFIGNW